MKHKCLRKLCLILVVIVTSCRMAQVGKPESADSLSTRTNLVCEAELDLQATINQELASEDWAEANRTKKTLLSYSNGSLACRTQVVEALIRTMNKPQLNFVTDRHSYFLWLNGSALLGELKAVEALDLLIDHLDLNDGEFGASMVHQPAILGVTAMGALAVPKLSTVLQHSVSQNKRLAAVLCLADIGGSEATKVLKHALSSESDSCVIRMIKIAIEILDYELKSQSRTQKQPVSDPQTDLRRQLLHAFRCAK